MNYFYLGVDLKMKHWCFVCCVLFLAAIVGVGVGVPLAMMEDFITSPQERLTVKFVLFQHNKKFWYRV